MFKNKRSVIDDRGYHQGFKETIALKRRMERRADWMIHEMDAQTGKKIMEIGCGTGYLSHYIARKTGMQVIGADICGPFIEEAKKKYILPNLSYQVLDVNKSVTGGNDKFDYILGNGILHHLYYNLENTLRMFKELLVPGGKIIFIEPNVYNPYIAAIFKNRFLRKWAKLEPAEMAFSKGFIRKRLVAAGFKNSKVEYKDFLLPCVPAWLIDPSIFMGDILEKTPLKIISQSIFIVATGRGSYE